MISSTEFLEFTDLFPFDIKDTKNIKTSRLVEILEMYVMFLNISHEALDVFLKKEYVLSDTVIFPARLCK